MSSVTIGNGTTDIGRFVFRDCTSLTSINIPNSVKSIGDDAFSGCAGLTNITIPDSVAHNGNYAFYNCSNLTRIILEGTMEQWNAIEKGNDWNYNTGSYTVYCTDGRISKSNS